MVRRRMVTVCTSLLLTRVALAATPSGTEFPFQELWKRIEERSPALRMAQQEQAATKLAWTRSRRHWLPRASLDGRVFETDDPGTSFFALLSQRELFPSDLSPDRLAHPIPGFYEQFTLHADWPVYEGGGPTAQARVSEQLAQQKELEQTSATIEQYSEAVRLYGMLLLFTESMEEWRALRAATVEIINGYQVGMPENPVGYSGLLALKALRNRTDITLAQDTAAIAAAREALSTLAGLTEPWHPMAQPFEDFARANLPAATGRPAPSPKVQSIQAASRASAQMVDVEKAKLFPRVGLFVDVPFAAGSRNAALAWIGGAYLRWDLFTPNNLDVTQQATLESNAASSRAEAEQQREDLEVTEARSTYEALVEALPLLAENTKMLAEQTQVTRQLFQSGAVNALQLAEAMSRRADLLQVRTEVRLRYLEALVTLARRSTYPVPGGAHGR